MRSLILSSKVRWPTIVKGNPRAPFSIAKLDLQTFTSEFMSHWVPHSYGLVPQKAQQITTKPRCRGGYYSFPCIAQLTFDPYLIMLSVKKRGINSHFLSLWYDSVWD